MAGSLCGSAFAQSSIQDLAGLVDGSGTFTAIPATDLKNGGRYVMVDNTSSKFHRTA